MRKMILAGILMTVLISGCIGGTGKIIAEEEVKMANEVHALHILVKTEEEAKGLLEEIKNGATFEKLAEMKSMCPSGKRGGDLGWFGRGMMVKEFEDAAFSLEAGKVSEPVKTQFGWHLIKVLEKR